MVSLGLNYAARAANLILGLGAFGHSAQDLSGDNPVLLDTPEDYERLQRSAQQEWANMVNAAQSALAGNPAVLQPGLSETVQNLLPEQSRSAAEAPSPLVSSGPSHATTASPAALVASPQQQRTHNPVMHQQQLDAERARALVAQAEAEVAQALTNSTLTELNATNRGDAAIAANNVAWDLQAQLGRKFVAEGLFPPESLWGPNGEVTLNTMTTYLGQLRAEATSKNQASLASGAADPVITVPMLTQNAAQLGRTFPAVVQVSAPLSAWVAAKELGLLAATDSPEGLQVSEADIAMALGGASLPQVLAVDIWEPGTVGDKRIAHDGAGGEFLHPSHPANNPVERIGQPRTREGWPFPTVRPTEPGISEPFQPGSIPTLEDVYPEAIPLPPGGWSELTPAEPQEMFPHGFTPNSQTGINEPASAPTPLQFAINGVIIPELPGYGVAESLGLDGRFEHPLETNPAIRGSLTTNGQTRVELDPVGGLDTSAAPPVGDSTAANHSDIPADLVTNLWTFPDLDGAVPTPLSQTLQALGTRAEHYVGTGKTLFKIGEELRQQISNPQDFSTDEFAPHDGGEHLNTLVGHETSLTNEYITTYAYYVLINEALVPETIHTIDHIGFLMPRNKYQLEPMETILLNSLAPDAQSRDYNVANTVNSIYSLVELGISDPAFLTPQLISDTLQTLNNELINNGLLNERIQNPAIHQILSDASQALNTLDADLAATLPERFSKWLTETILTNYPTRPELVQRLEMTKAYINHFEESYVQQRAAKEGVDPATIDPRSLWVPTTFNQWQHKLIAPDHTTFERHLRQVQQETQDWLNADPQRAREFWQNDPVMRAREQWQLQQQQQSPPSP